MNNKIFATIAALLLMTGAALAQPKCEKFESRGEPSGDRLKVQIALPMEGLPLREVGNPLFIVEVHVAPDQISQTRVPTINEVKEVRKCTYGTALIVSHIKLTAPTRITAGTWDKHLLTAIELPKQAVASKIVIRTKIGDNRYIGAWKTSRGRHAVVLERQ